VFPSKANLEEMSLYDLIAFAVMAYRHFGGIYEKAYRVLVEDFMLFPRIKV